MKSCGVIVRYINWRKWKKWFFNIPLFLFQLLFLVVGKILGKVEVEWGKIWHAAQASHVRLVLGSSYNQGIESYTVANFGYLKMEIQLWRKSWNDDKHLEYFDPTFESSPEFIAAMNEYAEDQVGKKYDWLQLLSPPANFPIWIIRPSKWGKEVIGWFNLPGAREFCSSGAIATLLWFTESIQVKENMRITDGNKSKFFGTYDPAMVMPCMIVISEKWEKVAQ